MFVEQKGVVKTSTPNHFKENDPLERIAGLCFEVTKLKKQGLCRCMVFTNSLTGAKSGGRPDIHKVNNIENLNKYL